MNAAASAQQCPLKFSIVFQLSCVIAGTQCLRKMDLPGVIIWREVGSRSPESSQLVCGPKLRVKGTPAEQSQSTLKLNQTSVCLFCRQHTDSHIHYDQGCEHPDPFPTTAAPPTIQATPPPRPPLDVAKHDQPPPPRKLPLQENPHSALLAPSHTANHPRPRLRLRLRLLYQTPCRVDLAPGGLVPLTNRGLFSGVAVSNGHEYGGFPGWRRSQRV